MSMNVLFPGALSTFQDSGRFGYQEIGVTGSGAMDSISMRQANALVGNAPDEAVLEITVVGPMLTFTEDAIVAVSGADMDLKLNQTPVPVNESFVIHAGDSLTFGFARSGCRSYLAVKGGFDLTPALGSCSTNLKCSLGGFEGRALAAGDQIPLKEKADLTSYTAKTFPWSAPDTSVTLRVVSGPQSEYFTKKGTATFFKEAYKVTEDADRMGYKLSGPAVEAAEGVDIVSDGITFGSVQIPPNGMPIVMMADHQTTGGYAKIGTVISSDLPKLAQLKPGDTVHFAPISVEDAQKIYKETQKNIKEYFR